MANDPFEAFNRQQLHAAGDESTKQNGFLLNLLPRVPGGDAIWGVGSRVWFWAKRMCGAILGVFGSENIPHKIELFLQKLMEDLKGNAEADHRRLQESTRQVNISAARQEMDFSSAAQHKADGPDHGLGRLTVGLSGKSLG